MPCLKKNRLKHKHNIIPLKAKMYYVCRRANHEAVIKMLVLYPFKIQQDGMVPVISCLLMNINQWKVFTEMSTMGFTNVT